MEALTKAYYFNKHLHTKSTKTYQWVVMSSPTVKYVMVDEIRFQIIFFMARISYTSMMLKKVL